MSCHVIHNPGSINSEVRSRISQRYKRVTKAINREFWESDNENSHSLYVGSYGRGTATNTSDIDMLAILSKDEYERYDLYRGNGQSRLLQAVKESIKATLPLTDVRADGQVIVMNFSDGMKIEVLPAFEETNWMGDLSFSYPDSNMGGNWRSTNPKAEQRAMREKNATSNGLLFDTCKHIRVVHSERYSSYKLSGIVIDSFVYEAIGDWRWSNGVTSSPEGTYEAKLLERFNSMSFGGRYSFQLSAPGSRQMVDTSKSMDCLGKVLRCMV